MSELLSTKNAIQRKYKEYTENLKGKKMILTRVNVVKKLGNPFNKNFFEIVLRQTLLSLRNIALFSMVI